MKTILCYGDSNTWGYDASTGGRFPPETRWLKVLQPVLQTRARWGSGAVASALLALSQVTCFHQNRPALLGSVSRS